MPGAVNGICAFTAAAAAAVCARVYLRLTGGEWLYFLLFLVMTMEMLNAAGTGGRFIYAEYHPARLAKNAAAGAALLAAVYAIIVGLFIFGHSGTGEL